MNKTQLERVREIFGNPDGITRHLVLRTNTEKQDDWLGSIEVHFTSPFLDELKALPGLEVHEFGRCGKKYENFVCERPEGSAHTVHQQGAKTWTDDVYKGA